MQHKKLVIVLSVIFMGVVIGSSSYVLYSKSIKAPNKISTSLETVVKNEDLKKSLSKQKMNDQKNTNMVRDLSKKGTVFNDEGIPVLMYHSIENVKDNKNTLVMSIDTFYKEMNYLKMNGYTTLSMEEVASLLKDNKPVPEKSVLITLDDGYQNNYVNAFPILKKFNFHATIFVISEAIGKDKDKMTTEQIKELSQNGIDIEAHTLNHVDLRTLSYDEQLYNIEKCKKEIESMTGKKVRALAYPSGKFNRKTVKAALNAGYDLAFTTHWGFSKKSNGLFSLRRVRVNSTDSIKAFRYKLNLK